MNSACFTLNLFVLYFGTMFLYC